MTTKPTARIYQGTSRNLTMLARKLQAGELVGVPTETVYGLAANALDAKACRSIFRAKKRPTTDPLIVHIHNLGQLDQIAQANPIAIQLAKAFWPGPMTLVLPKQDCVPSIVTSGLDSVAVRIPSHPLFRRLLKIAAIPIAAPSANPFGYVSPTTAEHVQSSLGDKIRYILDGGSCSVGLESTIIDVRNPDAIRLLRPGSITLEDINQVIGKSIGHASSKTSPGSQVAPGMLSQHYSPRARVILYDKLPDYPDSSSSKEAWVYFSKPSQLKNGQTYWLTPTGNQRHAARNLFALIRKLDAKGLQTIHIEKAPEGSHSAAINDRLQRAAAKL